MDVGAYEAKTHFAELLDRVEKGEEVTITRHGRPVARIVPARERAARPAAEVVAEIRTMRKGVRLRGLNIKDMIREGRP